ncbi:MAG: undecaprenyl-diphosphatase, partial [Alphaproteobacteria bacterium]|nr:undecaprenyl-diphosphatase [Alphaproteobacteria bacterium]
AIYLIPVLLMAMWLWGDTKMRNTAAKAFFVAMGGLAISYLIGFIWFEPRPFAIKLGHTYLKHAPDTAFPSDHVTVFSAICLTLLASGITRLWLATLVIGIGVAWARIFVGVHYPIDMVGSLVVSACSLAIITPIWKKVGGAIVLFGEKIYRRILLQRRLAFFHPNLNH